MSISDDEDFGEGETAESEENPLGLYEGGRNKAGDRHGQGKALLPNGDMYVGGYCRGLRHEQGLYVFAKNGARYDGNWRNGIKHGRGTFYYPDGTKYDGEWRNDKRSGFGAYFYRNGDVYEGSWRRGFRHGLGTYFYKALGSRFYGTWIMDRMQGSGQLIHDRHRYHGYWDTNLPHGRGCYIFEHGSIQHGYYAQIADPNPPAVEDETESKIEQTSGEEGDEEGTLKSLSMELKPPPLLKGVISVWRGRCVTAYNPDLLPPDPAPLQEEPSSESISDICYHDPPDEDQIIYLQKGEGEGEEGEGDDQGTFCDPDICCV